MKYRGKDKDRHHSQENSNESTDIEAGDIDEIEVYQEDKYRKPHYVKGGFHMSEIEVKKEAQGGFDWKRSKGMLLMLLSSLMITAMNIIIKYQSKTTSVSTIQAIVFRNFFLVGGCFFHMKYDNVTILDIKPEVWKFVLLRGILGFVTTIGQYAAYDYLPLSMAVTIVRTQPIFVTINCFLFLNETLSRFEIVSIVSAMFGVIMISNPQILLGSEYTQSITKSPTNNYEYYYIGVILALLSSFIGSFIFVVCRKLGKDAHHAMHPFYNGIITAFGGFWILFIGNYKISQITLFDAFLFTICGLCSWIQQESQSLALQIEKGGRSAAVSYIVVVNAFIADFLIFQEAIKVTDVIGAVFISFFTFLNALLRCFGKIN